MNLTVCVQAVLGVLLVTMRISFHADDTKCTLDATCDQAALDNPHYLSREQQKTFYSISRLARV